MSIIKNKTFILSVLSVFVAIMLLGYSAYGWMSLSREIRATGMNVSATVPQSLEISATGSDNDFGSFLNVKLGDYVPELPENTTFALLPASSYEGLSVWKTDTANNLTGKAICAKDEYENVDDGKVKFNPSTKKYEGYYIDFPIWLRTSSDIDQEIVLIKDKTKVTITSGNDKVVNVVRIGFLNDIAKEIAYSENQDYKDTLVWANSLAKTTEVVIKGNDKLSDIKPSKYIQFEEGKTQSTQTICKVKGSIVGDNFKYNPVKITLRIWIEGQDSACVASIGQSVFDIQIGFAIKEN